MGDEVTKRLTPRGYSEDGVVDVLVVRAHCLVHHVYVSAQQGFTTSGMAAVGRLERCGAPSGRAPTRTPYCAVMTDGVVLVPGRAGRWGVNPADQHPIAKVVFVVSMGAHFSSVTSDQFSGGIDIPRQGVIRCSRV